MSPKGYTKKVKVKGKPVAIRGATFKSMGDVASKGTGGGLISANTHGPTKFISPGSLNVKFEGKNVHLLGDMALSVQEVTVKGKLYHRVQTGPFPSRATAQDMCAQLKSQNQACIVQRR